MHPGNCILQLRIFVCEKLYPVLTHLPLLLLLVLYFHVHAGQAVISIMISYFCCQPPWMIALAVQYFTGSSTSSILAHTTSLLVFYLLYFHTGDIVASLLQESRKSLLLFGILPACYYIFDYVTTVYTNLMYDSSAFMAEFLPTVMVLFYIVFIALYHRQMQSANQLEMDNLVLSTQTQHASKVIENLREIQLQAIRCRHDLRHHVSFLKNCLENGQSQKAIDYLAQVQDDIEAITPVRSAETKQLTLSFLTLWEKQNREASVSESTHRFLLCCIFPIRICVPFCPTAWKTQCMHVRISRMKKTE